MLDLIGRVAARRIVDTTPSNSGRSLLCMMGLERPVVSAIARKVAAGTAELGNVEVFVHPSLVEGDVSPAMVSEETAPWHRNHAKPGVRVTVCTVPPDMVKALEPTLAHNSKIDEAWLLQEPSAWAIEGLPRSSHEMRVSFARVIEGLVRAGVAHDPVTVAEFVERVNRHVIDDGDVLEKAVRHALPALRLPKDSGDPRLKVSESTDNATRFFAGAIADARPPLYLKGKDGEPLNRNEMKRRLEAFAKDGGDPKLRDAIRALLSDRTIQDGRWTVRQKALAEFPWSSTEEFFGDARRKSKPTFGAETLAFFERQFRDALQPQQKAILDDLLKETSKPSEQLVEFFTEHRTRLQTEPKLYKRWERLIFRAPIETADLLEGLVRLSRRAASDVDDEGEAKPRVLLIRLRGAQQLDFWTRDRNTRVLAYLRDRYRGLGALLSPDAVMDFGRCWSEDWEAGLTERNESLSKAAVELEFEAFLIPADELDAAKASLSGKPPAHRAQLTWKPPAEALGLSLPVDLRWIRPRDANATRLLTGRVSPNSAGAVGSTAAVNLGARTSITDAFGQSRGALANPGRAENRVDVNWIAALDRITNDQILSRDQAQKLRHAFDTFLSAYGDAIEALLRGLGVGSPLLVDQARLYGVLLEEVAREAPQEVCIRELLAPLVGIGVLAIDGDRPAAVVTAWQPLRLAELAIKARQFASAIHQVVVSAREQRTGVDDFVEDRASRLTGTYYADVAMIMLPSNAHELLAETQALADCSLLEVVAGGAQPSLSDEPAEAVVNAFDKVGDEYLTLRPHEKANFSIVVLNAESENLPLALASGLSRRIETEPDLRCDLVVTDDDPIRLRHVYERQNRKIGQQLDGGLTSEAARSFLSRLRVGIHSPDAIEREGGRKAHDIVLLQDVVSRHSTVRWTKGEVPAETIDFETYAPTARSKRRPFRKGNTTSALYLTAPVQPKPCQAYLDAMRHVLMRDVAISPEPWLPIQDVEFQSGEVRELLVKAHALGVWVMTFDRVADKRLVGTDERRIIRYFSVPGSTHNVIVSTEIGRESLAGCMADDLDAILPSASEQQLEAVKREIFDRAAELSGGVVMKAAQWPNYAQELLGLMLTQRELDRLLRAGRENRTGWFFLDDYREFLDLTGEMADILAIDFSKGPSGPVIRIVVAESKYVGEAGISEQRRRSLSQLESTFTGLTHRLLHDGSALDPSIWRNRLADMVLEHMEPFDQVSGIGQQTWLEALRSGSLPIEVSGYSMVFSHDLQAVAEGMPHIPDGEKPIAERRRLAQWVVPRAKTAAALLSLGDDSVPPMICVPTSWPAFADAGPAPASAPIDLQQAEPVQPASADKVAPTGEAAPGAVLSEALVQLQVPIAHSNLVVTAGSDGWHPAVSAVLHRMSRPESAANADAWLAGSIDRLRSALQAEGIDAPILSFRLTPNSGLVYVGGQTLTVNWLERKQTDLMTRYGLQIDRITPMPGQIAIGLRRPARSILHLADAWLRREVRVDGGPAMRFAPLLGEREDDGSLCHLPLAAGFAGQERAAPHSLISGNTGSGKGILVTNMLLDLCAMNGPEELDLYLIDPKKGVDYAWAKRLPQLRGGIISDQDVAKTTFDELVGEMERRYEAIQEEGCRNIDHFNRVVPEHRRLRRTVIFFDEVANWMQDDDFKQSVDSLINKIATMSRAAGFHLFMVYQRADNQVMTMQLRTNLGNKLILRLGDEGSSKIALNEKGAERLLGKGHLIAKLDSDEKIYLQIPYIGEEEVEELADAVISSWTGRQRQAAA